MSLNQNSALVSIKIELGVVTGTTLVTRADINLWWFYRAPGCSDAAWTTHTARSRASVSQIQSLDDQLTWATTGSSDTDNVIFVISSWSPRYDGSRHTVLYHANLRKFWRNAKPRTDWIYTNCHNTVSRYTVTQGRSDVRLDVTFYSQLV